MFLLHLLAGATARAQDPEAPADPAALVDPEAVWATLIDPAALWSAASSIVLAIIIAIAGRLIAGAVQKALTASLERANFDQALALFLGKVLRALVMFAFLIAAADTLGFDTTSLTAILASAGLAIGLALQGSLSNLAAGVMILFYRPFSIGDVVTIGGETGLVKSIDLFQTMMMKPDGTKVVVPNDGITSGTILNHTVSGRRRCTIDIGVDYGSDLTKVREALVKAVSSVDDLAVLDEDPGYSVVFLAFGGSSLDWQVYAHFKPEHWWAGQEKVRIRVYEELNAAGIGIPFPQLDVRFPDGMGGGAA